MHRFTMCMLDLMTILLLTVLTLVADTQEPRASGDTDAGFVNVHFVVRGKPSGFTKCGCSVDGAQSKTLDLSVPHNSQPSWRIPSASDDEVFTALSYETQNDACVIQFRGAATSRFDRPITFRFLVECTDVSEWTVDVLSSAGSYRPPQIELLEKGQHTLAVTVVRRGNVLKVSHTVIGGMP